MAICSECNQPVPPMTAYIAGRLVATGLVFSWACEHHPQEDAEVILASTDCVVRFAKRHPDYDEILSILLVKRTC